MTRKDDNQTKAVFELLDVFLQYRWRFLVPAFFVCAMVLIVGMILPRKYEAKGVFEQRTDMMMSDAMLRDRPVPSHARVHDTLRGELAGHTAVNEVLDDIVPVVAERLDLRESQIDRPSLINQIVLNVLVVAEKFEQNSEYVERVEVSYVSDDPVVSQHVVNALIENYIQKEEARAEKKLHQSADFYRQEVNKTQAQIEKLENLQLTLQLNNAELMPDNPNNLQIRLASMHEELAEVKQKRDALKLKVDRIGEQLDTTPTTSDSVVHGTNPELKILEDELRELEAKHQLYTGVYKMTEKHPDLIALRQQITSVRARIAKTPRQVVKETHVTTNDKRDVLEMRHTDVETEYQALNQQARQLEARIKRLEQRSEEMFPVLAEYRRLHREIDKLHRQIGFWEDNLRRVDVALTAESSNKGTRLEIVKRAGQGHRPISPNLMQVLMASVVFSVLAGLLSVLLAHRTDETFASGHEATEALGLPLIGTVSEIISRRQRRLRRLRTAIVYPTSALAMSLVLLGLAGLLYISLERPALFQELQSRVESEVGVNAAAADDPGDDLTERPRLVQIDSRPERP